MARLSSADRSALPTQDFAGPGRSYPVPDESHARNALARVSQYGYPELKQKIRDKVRRKFPSIKLDGE